MGTTQSLTSEFVSIIFIRQNYRDNEYFVLNMYNICVFQVRKSKSFILAQNHSTGPLAAASFTVTPNQTCVRICTYCIVTQVAHELKSNHRWDAVLSPHHIAEKSAKTKLGKCVRVAQHTKKKGVFKIYVYQCTYHVPNEHIMIEKFSELSLAWATALNSTTITITMRTSYRRCYAIESQQSVIITIVALASRCVLLHHQTKCLLARCYFTLHYDYNNKYTSHCRTAYNVHTYRYLFYPI